ncbi:MAG: NAD(P)/FAD-dependent oxidoreductase [Acidimicrobiales bacterium]|nr:NAD(P)/FAD-dependent oxidoreductase [Acidimicrobiales bacterium]
MSAPPVDATTGPTLHPLGRPADLDAAARALEAADDALIDAAVEQATFGALLPALAQVTGDLTLAPGHLRPNPDDFMDPQGGLTPEQLDECRALAAAALRDLRDGRRRRVSEPPVDDEPLRPLAAHIVGDANVDAYLPLLLEELAPEGVDRRAPAWHKDDIAPDTPFHVAVVGAGMSGLLAAHRLAQAGVDVTVFDKNDDVGGTWLENTYPGCRVDVPNDLYSYSFAHAVWPQRFSDQATLLEYFRRFADATGVRARMRFATEVVGAEWSDATQTWSVRVRPTGTGEEETVEANALVSAVGQLNRPLLPDLPGIDTFTGPWFHSARWRHDVDLTGKRVAVIGTGASAAQFIPEVAEQAGELTVFQRTPNWLAPTPEYHEEVTPEAQWLVEALPEYGDWHRLWQFWRMHEGLTAAAKVDPEWDQSATGSVSLLNEMVRLGLVEYLNEQFAERPDLLEAVVPTYPPIAKRIVRDNGVWARTLTRPNVRLVTDPIEAVTPTGVRAGGEDHAFDVIIYGTGFQASQFLTPMQLTGRPGPERPHGAGGEGLDLHEHWAGDARAYLGVTVPHFPNLFVLYGPNTNIVINGSIIFFSECEVRYLTACVHLLLAGGHHALDPKVEVHDAFNRRVDAANAEMAWGASSVNSWYKNATGRVAQNWPFPLLEYWQLTQAPDPDDYDLT